MTAVVVTLVAGAVFGLALAAPPGPMNAVIAEESVLRGRLAGVRAGLGAMSADAIFLVLALAGAVSVVRDSTAVETALFAVGGVLMLWFALEALREARAASTFVGESVTENGRGFRKAFVLALTNPFQIAFWLTVGVGLLEPGRHDVLAAVPLAGDALRGTLVVATGSPTLIVGFFGGIACWIVGFPAALAALGRRVDAAAPLVAAASAAVLGVVGASFLLEAAARLV